MESLSDPTRGLRVVATRYTGTYISLIISLHFQFDIQSHHVFFPFDVQSHIFILTFRAAISVSTFGSVICPQFDIQSHHVSFPFEVQSHIFILSFRVTFSVSAFGSVICPQLDIQSHHVPFSFDVQSRIFILAVRVALLVSVSRAIIAPQFRRSEPLSLLSYDVQSHPSQFDIQICQFSVLAFRTTIFLQLDVQSQHRFSITTFRVVLHSLAFIATISSQFGVQSHCPFIVWHSELSSYHDRVFIANFSTFKAIVHNQEFRVVVHSQSLEPSYLLFDIQIHQSVCHSEPPFFSSSTFRATFLAFRVPSIQSYLSLLVRNSEPHSQHLESSFSFSSVFKATLLAFRIAIFFQFSIQSHSYHSESLSSVLGVQSCVFILTFKAIVWLGIQCHHLLLVLALRAIMHTHSSIQSHHLFSFWCSKSFFPSLVIHSHGSWNSYSLALHILLSQF